MPVSRRSLLNLRVFAAPRSGEPSVRDGSFTETPRLARLHRAGGAPACCAARGWDRLLFTDFWRLPGPVLDHLGTRMKALLDWQRASSLLPNGLSATATRRKADAAQSAAGLPAHSLVDEAARRAARTGAPAFPRAATEAPATWADVSEWQPAVLDDSYPHPVFAFRTNDGDHQDRKAIGNARAAMAMLDAGRLHCVIAYYFFRPGRANCDLHKTILENAGLWGDARLVTMVDVEGDGGQVRGDQSPEVDDEIARLRQWHENPRRVIGYWNPTADPGLWPTRPEGLRLVIPRYNQRPGDLSEVPEPYRSEAIAHQHTSSGQCPPFGACDLNQSLIPLPALLAALAVPPTKETSMPDDIADHLQKIELLLAEVLAQLGPWAQTGNRTLLDTTAAVGQKLGVPGCRDPLAEPQHAA